MLVFYYGYHCNHCVKQLFGLHDDIERFRALGATVVAVSADLPETTRDASASMVRLRSRSCRIPATSWPSNMAFSAHNARASRRTTSMASS